MGAVGFAFRSELRGRWRAWLAIVLLISIVGGFVLAATSAGRRTADAYPQFVKTYGYDATVYTTRALPELAKLPSVSSATALVNPANGQPTCLCTHQINITSAQFSVLVEAKAGPPLWKLVSGHQPDPSDPDQVLASFSLQQDDGVHVGTVIHVPFFSPPQAAAANSVSGVPPRPLGPTVDMHVVGIAASEFDFPSGLTPSYELFATPAFSRDVVPRTATDIEYAVRLKHGAADLPRFDIEANALGRAGVEGVGNSDGQVELVQASIHPQAIGWFILAALAALVGLVVVGQALARQSSVESEGYPTLSALGMGRPQIIMLGMARDLLVALTGALGAVILATAISPFAPVGEARLAETSTGIAFDPFVLLIGALAIVLIVLVLGIWPNVRAARGLRPDDSIPVTQASPVVVALANMGAPPSTLIGVGNALQRRGLGAKVPVGTAFFGTVLAVIALGATAVFGASLSHLTATPLLYGDAYQLSFEVVPGLPNPGLLGSIEQDKGISGITSILTTHVLIDKETIGAVTVDDLRGPLLLSTAQGHLPDANGEIGLGAATMRQVHAHIGSVVRITVARPTGGTRTEPFRVVSTVPLPVTDGFAGLGNGAVMTLSGYEAAACPSGRDQAACRFTFERSSIGSILTKVAPGTRGKETIAHFLRTDQSVAILPITPTSLINFGEAINFPLIFGGILAVFGAATLAHLLVVSVSRRRKETGLLKVLGFVNRQVVSTVAWQATTVALIGIAVGLPLGVVVGRATWVLFASRLGVVPVSVVPIWILGFLALGVIVVANLLAIGPELAATRTKPARLFDAP